MESGSDTGRDGSGAGACPGPGTSGTGAGTGAANFRVSVDLVTTDVIVRDQRSDQFVADLKPGEFEIYEDGVKQEIVSLVLTHGGRVYNVQTPPPAPVQEGIILPTQSPDERRSRARVPHLHRRSPSRLPQHAAHPRADQGDAEAAHSRRRHVRHRDDRHFVDLRAADLRPAGARFAISKVTGGGLKAKEIIEGQSGSQGPTELRHRAHVAFSTAYDLMNNLEKLQNRRKAVIYISSGYDFNPFEQSRLEEQAQRMHVES